MSRHLKLLLLLVLHTGFGREIPASEHFSRLVQVSVVEVEGEEEGGKVEVVAGPLHLHLGRVAGSQLLRRLLAQEVSSHHFRGSWGLFLTSLCYVVGPGGGRGAAWRILVCREAGGRA